MKPVESKFVSIMSMGEGWHNYHHAFPWDYRAAELGFKYSPTTFIIDVLATFGLAYDLRTTSPHLIQQRVLRTGDGSHPISEQRAAILEESEVVEETRKKEEEMVERNEDDFKGARLIKRPISVQG